MGTGLCALSQDRAWAEAWRAALTRRGVRVKVFVDSPVVLAASGACTGTVVGPGAASMRLSGRPRPVLAIRLEDVGYLAGAALGGSLQAGGGPVLVALIAGYDTSPGANALLAGLASGLRATAPPATLVVSGRPSWSAAHDRAVSVVLDPRRPHRLIAWQGVRHGGTCGIRLDALALSAAVAAQGGLWGAGEGAVACTLTPPDGEGAAFEAAALSRLTAGLRPPVAPEYHRSPLAVPPWLSARARSGRSP